MPDESMHLVPLPGSGSGRFLDDLVLRYISGSQEGDSSLEIAMINFDAGAYIRQEWLTNLSFRGHEELTLPQEADCAIVVWQLVECLLAFSSFPRLKFQRVPKHFPALHYDFDEFALEIGSAACVKKFSAVSFEQGRRELIMFELDRMMRLHAINTLVLNHPSLKSVLLKLWRSLPNGYQKASRVMSQNTWALKPSINCSVELIESIEWMRQCWQLKSASCVSEQFSSCGPINELAAKFVRVIKAAVDHSDRGLSEKVFSSLQILFSLGDDMLSKLGFGCIREAHHKYTTLSRNTLLESDGSLKAFRADTASGAIVDLSLLPESLRNGPPLTLMDVAPTPWNQNTASLIVHEFICCDVDHPGAVVDAAILPHPKPVIQHALRLLVHVTYQLGILSQTENEKLELERRLEFFSFLQSRLGDYIQLDEKQKQTAEEIGRAAKFRRMLTSAECWFILGLQAKSRLGCQLVSGGER